MEYQIQENCLTICLPNELYDHNAEQVRRLSDQLVVRKNYIKYILFDFRTQILWTVRASESLWEDIGRSVFLAGKYRQLNTNERLKENFTDVGSDENNSYVRGGIMYMKDTK